MCKKRKSKCDMKRPSCSMCVDHNSACAYSLRHRKPGPRKGSRQVHKLNVQHRLNRIEDLLHQGRLSEEDASQEPLQGVEHGRRCQHGQSPTRRSDSSHAEPEPSYGELEPSPGATSSSSSTSILQLIVDAINWTRYLKPVSRTTESGVGIVQAEISGYDMFLTPNLERHLLSLYFACVSLPVPIFSKAKFFRNTIQATCQDLSWAPCVCFRPGSARHPGCSVSAIKARPSRDRISAVRRLPSWNA